MIRRNDFSIFGFALLGLCLTATSAHADLLTFEGSVPAGSFQNGGPVTNNNGFTLGSFYLPNSYNSSFGGFWSGWALSSVSNSTTAGFTNQYAAYPGSGSGSAAYGVGFGNTYLSFADTVQVQKVDLANTTYAALSMLNGDRFAKKFGGTSGNDPDFLKLTITGYSGSNRTGSATGSMDYYLADYRFSDNTQDFVRNQWNSVDLTGLGQVRSIGFQFDSSDTGTFGINTPTYFALDNLSVTAVPEPTSMACLSVALGVGGLVRWSRRSRRRQTGRQADREPSSKA